MVRAAAKGVVLAGVMVGESEVGMEVVHKAVVMGEAAREVVAAVRAAPLSPPLSLVVRRVMDEVAGLHMVVMVVAKVAAARAAEWAAEEEEMEEVGMAEARAVALVGGATAGRAEVRAEAMVAVALADIQVKAEARAVLEVVCRSRRCRSPHLACGQPRASPGRHLTMGARYR